MTDLFTALTPDWVLRAVERAGFEPSGHCLALNSLENRVYDLRLETGDHVVAKFYRPGRWSREAILEEHQFLAELAEAEIPVCKPLAFADGSTLAEVEGIRYAVWPRTGGRAPDELSDQDVEMLGRLLARIHAVGASRPAPHRRRLDVATYVHEPLSLITQPKFLPPRFRERYVRAAERIAALHTERSAGVPVHRIHGDCHLGNLIRGRDGFFFLDFDDMVVGPAVQDVWMLVAGRDALDQLQRALFVEAYQQFRPFEHRWLGMVETLRAMRWIHYAAWIARRWHDPAFPAAFPNFNSEAYWERETIDLEQQVALLDGAPPEPSQSPFR